MALRRRRRRRGAGLQCGPPAVRQRHASVTPARKRCTGRGWLATALPDRQPASNAPDFVSAAFRNVPAGCSAEGPAAVFGYDPYRRAVGDEAATQPDQVGRCDFPFPRVCVGGGLCVNGGGSQCLSYPFAGRLAARVPMTARPEPRRGGAMVEPSAPPNPALRFLVTRRELAAGRADARIEAGDRTEP